MKAVGGSRRRIKAGAGARALALFLAGAVAGSAATAARLGDKVDRLSLDNAILMDEVERLAGTLESRERALTDRVRLPVRSVEVEVVGLGEEHARLHVEQLAHDLLKDLVGEEVESINVAIVEKTLERAVTIDRRDYTLAPALIVVGPRVFVRVLVKEGKTEAIL